MPATRRRKRIEPAGSFDPNRTYTKRGLLKAIGLGEEALTEAVDSGKVKPAYKAGKNWYRGREIEAWLWSESK